MLRTWRTGQAKRLGASAFRIMSDKVLLAIAVTSLAGWLRDKLAIPGMGIASVEKYGAQLYRILNQARLCKLPKIVDAFLLSVLLKLISPHNPFGLCGRLANMDRSTI